MLDLAEALVGPLAKLLLRSWLGDTAADVGANLYELAKRHFSERSQIDEAGNGRRTSRRAWSPTSKGISAARASMRTS